MKTFDYFVPSKLVVKAIEAIADTVCSKFVMKSNSTVCNGAVKEMTVVILPVLAESLLSAETVCTELLGLCSTPHY